uniref:C2H2-type domain-containing protein n=3 Tax=Clytia hemisphaerica TaxID=252671 RepID=A0A7M5VF96_9CNID
MEVEEAVETPKKYIRSLSPSAHSICILCQKDIVSKRRHCLFENDRKTKPCKDLEQCLSITIKQTTDFRIICENCNRSIDTDIKKRGVKRGKFQRGRQVAEQKYVRTKLKRLSKGTIQPPKSRKKLTNEFEHLKIGAENLHMKVTVSEENGSAETEIHVTKQQQKLIKLAMANNKKHLLNYILSNLTPEDTELNSIVLKFIGKNIKSEIKQICSSKNETTTFRCNDVSKLTEFSYDTQYQELETNAPFTFNSIVSIAKNPRENRNKNKTLATCIPAVMNAVNSLLMCRNQTLNQCAVLNSIILKRGKADKQCFARFNALQTCVSYQNTLGKQTELGKDHRSTIKEWSRQIAEYQQAKKKSIHTEILDQSKEFQLTKCDNPVNLVNIESSFLDKAAASKPKFRIMDSITEEESLNVDQFETEESDKAIADLSFDSAPIRPIEVSTPNKSIDVEFQIQLSNDRTAAEPQTAINAKPSTPSKHPLSNDRTAAEPQTAINAKPSTPSKHPLSNDRTAAEPQTAINAKPSTPSKHPLSNDRTAAEPQTAINAKPSTPSKHPLSNDQTAAEPQTAINAEPSTPSKHQLPNDHTAFSQDTNSNPDFVKLYDICRTYRPPKFVLVGDNLEYKVVRRHMTTSKQNIDYHMFNMMGVRNRVNAPVELEDMIQPPLENKLDIDLSNYFPNKNDESKLATEFSTLVFRVLTEYREDMSRMRNHLRSVIPHDYMEETKRKSEITTLGILNKNENKTEDMIEIMEDLHTMVPCLEDGELVKTFAIGDLLTLEREIHSQEDLRCSTTAIKRLEGLIPGLADFHTYGNFMEVVWHFLYDASSSSDVGTLYQARNFLNARNVSKEPMKCVNACEELLNKYTEALTLAAFHEYIETNKIDLSKLKEPTAQNKESLKNVISKFVESYVIAETPDIAASAISYDCQFCTKSYKRKAGLVNHLKKQHPGNEQDESEKSGDDCIVNYSKNALMLGYLVKNFADARRYGDGERIIRLYKFLMVLFKIDHRSKYGFYSLQLLAQINNLLPPALAFELKWNRTVNNTGRYDGNVELDRELEHRNKYAKEELKHFQGKLTEQSIKRVSQSYDKVREIVDKFDIEANVSKQSGKHTVPDWKADVLELSEQFKSSKLFTVDPNGRSHKRFPGFPKNVFNGIDATTCKNWALDSVMDEFNSLNIYKHPFYKV